jgi:hypothetical protein
MSSPAKPGSQLQLKPAPTPGVGAHVALGWLGLEPGAQGAFAASPWKRNTWMRPPPLLTT